MSKSLRWEWTKESALEVAVDAICRRARVLEGQDPDVAEALRVLAANLDMESFEKKGTVAA